MAVPAPPWLGASYMSGYLSSDWKIGTVTRCEYRGFRFGRSLLQDKNSLVAILLLETKRFACSQWTVEWGSLCRTPNKKPRQARQNKTVAITAVTGRHTQRCVDLSAGVSSIRDNNYTENRTEQNRAGFLKARLGSSRISEILHLDFWCSNQHEFKQRKTRTARLVFNITMQALW